MLGDLYFQERNFRQALATYDLIGNPEIRIKTFFNHLQAHFEMKEYLRVIEKAENYLKQRDLKGDQQIKVRYLLAESSFRYALTCKDMEAKILYLKMAKPQYKILTQTKYSNRVLFPLAEIHRLLREDARAATLYTNLAEKYPQHRERFLFQAAILQINQDKKAAIKSFSKVYEMGGKRARLAAFNQLILLYQSEQYEQFLNFYSKVISQMPEQKVGLLQFYEGRCHYYMGDYQLAVMPLENFIGSANGRSKELKTALLLLVNCSRYLKDITLLERTLYTYKTSFPKDAEAPKVLMIHSQMCRENGNFNQALSDLKTLMKEYPGYNDTEGVMYDYGLLLSQTDKWMQSREVFLAFLDKFPKSERQVSAWRHLLNCCIEEIKNPSEVNSDESKKTFIKVLQTALAKENILTPNERKKYLLVMIKCQLEIGQHEEAVPLLSQYITDVSDPPFLSEAHLLLAICHKKNNSELSFFIQHSEKALAYNPKLPDNQILHLELYNAYLSKGLSTSDPGNKEYFYNHAANHLFESNAWRENTIKRNNYLWLTNHYYHLAKKGNPKDFERARTLYTQLLGFEKNKKNLQISANSLYLEPEVLRFSYLLEINGQAKDQISLLELLVQMQEEQPHLSWKFKRRSIFELAKAYEHHGQFQNALNSYQFLVRTKKPFSSQIATRANLHLAKLKFRLLKPHQRNVQNPEMSDILHRLKDIAIQKKLPAEPLHLEAALNYAEIRISLANVEEQDKNALFYLKRMHDDFYNAQDPVMDEYHHFRSQSPEKNVIFMAYMQYIDTQMLLHKANIAAAEGKSASAMQYKEEALHILDSLLKNESSLRPYLLNRVKRAYIEIRKQL